MGEYLTDCQTLKAKVWQGVASVGKHASDACHTTTPIIGGGVVWHGGMSREQGVADRGAWLTPGPNFAPLRACWPAPVYEGPPSRESTAPHVATLLREGGGEISRTIRFLDRWGNVTRAAAVPEGFLT
jgi:hypothetical protein